MPTLRERVVESQRKLVKEQNVLLLAVTCMADQDVEPNSVRIMRDELWRLAKLIQAYNRTLVWLPVAPPAE